MTGFEYNRWLGVARKHSRKRDEAEDLLQEAIVAALRAGRAVFSDGANARWFTGTIRKLALMRARTAARQKNRDGQAVWRTARTSEAFSVPHPFLGTLSDGARKVATLIGAGMTREEIVSILNLTPTAFRQRLTTIRKAWKMTEGTLEPFAASQPDLSLGRIRRALLSILRDQTGIGAYDPDGHLFILTSSNSQKRSARQQ